MKREFASGRRPRSQVLRHWALCVLMLLQAGCSKKSEKGLVLVASSVTAPPILRSEAEQVVIPVRIDAPVQFENRSGVEQYVTIAKTGCSCYGMATVDSVLKPGERVKVLAGESKSLFFVAKELNAEAEQAFRVGLYVGGSPDGSATADNEELRADCSMKIVPDLVVEPASIVVDVSGEEERTRMDPKVYPLKVTRVTRGRPVERTGPNLFMAPQLLEAQPFQLEKPPEEIAPGLWRTMWKTSVELKSLPDEVHENGGRFTFDVEFPEAGNPPPKKPGSLRDATLPTVLDVVSSVAPRRVSGQLIVRRSKGIIAPAQLHFGVITMGSESRTRRLIMTAADHRPFQVTVGDVPGRFEADVDSSEPAAQQWATVTFTPDAAGDIEGVLTLKTSHPDQRELLIKLKARVQ